MERDWLCPGSGAHCEGFLIPVPHRLEVDEQVVEIVPVKRLGSAVDQPGGLVPHHLPGLDDHGVVPALVVLDVEGPVLPHILGHVQNGGDHVGVKSVHMRSQPRPVGVSSLQFVGKLKIQKLCLLFFFT